jgi:ribosomal protein S4E
VTHSTSARGRPFNASVKRAGPLSRTRSSRDVAQMNLKDGDYCEVVGGTHAGKSGTVNNIKISKTGHVTVTVVQESGNRFKTLAKNVVAQKVRRA